MDSIINDASLLGMGAKLLSKKQAADEFGIAYRTLERWYNCGYISYVRIGGRVFVSYAEIYRIRDQFVDRQPNGNYMAAPLPTFDELQGRQSRSGQSHYCYGARR